jgi:transglutaminase-like putative cysteine protease
MKNFDKAQSYKPGQFPDITENEWFGCNKQGVVCKAYELGLMQGKGANFDPNVGVTLAEAITIAARVSNIYNGGGWAFHQSSPWYSSYLEYAVHKGIVQFDTFEDLTKPATRAEMAYIFARALPVEEFTSINTIEALPDVNTGTPYYNEILRLYKSGILTGNDAYGTFGPNDSITRAQAAAIITRIALPSERVSFTLTPKKDEETVKKEEPAKEEQVSEEPVNEEPVSAIPVWSEVYTEGMSVKTKDELTYLVDAAFMNLIPRFEILLENAAYEEYYSDVDFSVRHWSKGTTKSHYDHQTKVFVQEADYFLSHQLQAIIFNRKAVEQYASEEVKAYDTKMNAILDKTIKPGMTDKQKVKAVHDYMVVNYKYDIDFEKGLYGNDTYSFRGLLNNGTGVCQAYAELFYLFMCYLDIECYYVGGAAKGASGEYGPHAWNVVYVDDGYYHVDVTFDDPVPDAGSKISYDYFLKTDDEMARDHAW